MIAVRATTPIENAARVTAGTAKGASNRKCINAHPPSKESPSADIAPEALYWAGVALYKKTNDPSALAHTAEAFTRQYRDSIWAKKASVWLKPETMRDARA